MSLSEAVQGGDIESVQQSLQDPNINLNLIFLMAVEHNQSEILQLLEADPRFDIDLNSLMVQLMMDNKLSQFQTVLQNFQIPDIDLILDEAIEIRRNNFAEILLTSQQVIPNHHLITAQSSGNHRIFDLLLADPRIDPSFNDNQALKASLNRRRGLYFAEELIYHPRIRLDASLVPLAINHPRIYEYLHQRFPQSLDSEVIITAIKDNSLFSVELIKDYGVDFSFSNNKPLQIAVQMLYPEMVKLILSDSRVDPTVGLGLLFEYLKHRKVSIPMSNNLGYFQGPQYLLNEDDQEYFTPSENYVGLTLNTGNLDELYTQPNHEIRNLFEIIQILLRDPRTLPKLINNPRYDWLIRPIVKDLMGSNFKSSTWRDDFKNYYSQYFEAIPGSLQYITLQQFLNRSIQNFTFDFIYANV